MQNSKLHRQDDELEYFCFSFKGLPLNGIKTCQVFRISSQGHVIEAEAASIDWLRE